LASLSMTQEERQAVEAFRRDVVEASLDALILVRFTADWCGPCKQIAPLIEKVIAEAGKGRARQVAIDVDRNRIIAEQFRVQSVPTVYAFVGGRPVDGFVGVRSERELKAFIEKNLAALPSGSAESGIEALINEAAALLADGDAAQAAELYAGLARELPDRADVIAGYARALLALGEIEGAEAALGMVPPDNDDPQVVQARAALELVRRAAPPDRLRELRSRIDADPVDHAARIELADALFAAGDRDAAAEQLLASIAADRDWNEGEARTRLLKFIEAVGLGDPWSVGVRRRLRSLLFA
jgi:putative thioredoxin